MGMRDSGPAPMDDDDEAEASSDPKGIDLREDAITFEQAGSFGQTCKHAANTEPLGEEDSPTECMAKCPLLILDLYSILFFVDIGNTAILLLIVVVNSQVYNKNMCHIEGKFSEEAPSSKAILGAHLFSPMFLFLFLLLSTI
jgi:hypothetical protein